MITLLLWMASSPAQPTVPGLGGMPLEPSPPVEVPPVEGLTSDALEEGAEPLPPPPWVPIPVAERVVERVPLLGPWPDGWRPDEDGHAGLPTVDVLLGDVLDPGRPYGAGPVQGPTLDDLGTSPIDPEPVPTAEAEAEALAEGVAELESKQDAPEPNGDAPEPDEAGSELAAPAPAPSSWVDPLTGAASTWTDGSRRSLAEDLLPPPPRRGAARAIGFCLLALLALLLAGGAERLQARVRTTGLLPRLLSTATGIGRASVVPLLFLALLSVLPPAWGVAVPFALVAVAVAMGWSSRELLADIFAGFVLTVERRIRMGDRVDLGEDGQGTVQALGLRAACLSLDDGTLLTIPNHRLAARQVRIDPDATPTVVVHLPVRGGRSTVESLTLLHELVLIQPWLAPGRAPRIGRDPKHPDTWRIEARIILHLHAEPFRLGLIGLWEREHAGRKGAGEAP